MSGARNFKVLVVAGLAVVVAAACAGDEPTSDGPISGVVTEFAGDLTGVESFVVLDAQGKSHLFYPTPDLLFLGGPLSHLGSHVVSGVPVTVTFETSPDGRRIAVHIVDQDGGGSHEPDETEPDDHTD